MGFRVSSAPFRTEAAKLIWRDTIWTPTAWRAWNGRSKFARHFVPHGEPRLFTHEVFKNWSMALWVDFIPPDSHYLGWNPISNLKRVWATIEQFYRESRTPASRRFRSLGKLTMFVRKKGYPKLRGKGYERKIFGKALLHL